VLSGKRTEPFKQLLETRARVVLGPVTLEADAEMVTDARFLSLHSPELRIEAIFGLEDFHTTPLTLVATHLSLCGHSEHLRKNTLSALGVIQ
jgi:hypothetical protein